MHEGMASRATDVTPTGMIFVGTIILVIGIAGLLLSTMAIASGFGLRKMKTWGYICSYLTMILYTLVQFFIWRWWSGSPPMGIILFIVASISTSIAIAINLIKHKIPT
jgi:hypothetical protein